ncbi:MULTISPECIES: beta-ketoacyl synthase N-terminal-like domain-containing protein [Streptomyces]|uniref:beta-ketoacyl synthase N-terminal-like domain-containing protein n=1 Tax=Streptomyces TaxID=1883 RepID=UPI001E506CD2|nr:MULTISPECIES: beta-ketoacyl synthase N-terminal-like domain-containing protein [Streptomyces]UFQ17183.1 3-oxoacyl-ACP synthase [Streptomyces huasconensis]WCL86783.1 beta-ketoacyl synthase N-terminal-like domain-containing protein [Streptomyces sp. JCM 35825]
MIITAWSALSPYGTDDRDLADAARPLPDAPRPVPGFEPREYLGRQGTRTMGRATALTVAAASRLLTKDEDLTRTGLILGTTNGSAQSILEVNRASREAKSPHHIPPSSIQNAAMNSIAGQTAIWHGLKGPNTTLAGGTTTGLLALGYCRRLLLTGRADVLLTGAVEELSEARSWVRGGTAPLAEGCALVRLEADATGGLAEVLAVTSLVTTDGDAGTAVRRVAQRVLDRASPGEVWATIGSGTWEDAESKALTAVCPSATQLPPVTEAVGQLHSATGAFQLVSALTRAAASGPGDRVVLLTSAEPQGIAAAAVVRIKGESLVA